MWLFNKVLEALTIFGHHDAPIEDFETALNTYASNANLNFNSNELNAIKQSWSPKFLETLESMFAPQSKLETSFVHPKLHSSTDPNFELFKLTDFPNYQLRIKEPKSLHTDRVQQYSGYIDVLDEDKHFFFWFYESRNDPKKDPLVLWLNGGPGCSSSTGQFFELGPGFVNKSLEIEYNPHAWNNHANILFLDQPVNVGYSYSKNRVDNSRVAGEDVYAFLEIFMQSFPQYTGNGFHISGESYAGMYLPAIGKAILDHKDRSFNLSSALIGNPVTDPVLQSFSSVAMACGDGGYPSVLSEEQCSSLYAKVPICESLLQKCYDSKYNKFVCGVAQAYCASLDEPYIETGRNPYDITDQCGDDCYPEINYIEEYMRRPEVIEAVGSDIDNFVGCSNEVGLDFLAHLDGVRNEGPDVLHMLENGIDVLFYDGALDWICSWPGVYRLVERLRYKHHAEFVNKPVSVWEVDGKPAGETKKVANLAWMKVYGAGHMVPHDRGKQAEQMFSQWLADRKFTSS